MNEGNAAEIMKILRREYRFPRTALEFSSPLQILIATMLSAQCTDSRVNEVTKTLFKKYKSVKDYAFADLKEFEQDIRSTGFYRNKAKNIINSAKIIHEKFNSKVPNVMEELITLPGVARKTANLVLSEGYGIIVGIAVDTHVKRLSFRLGLTRNTEPEKIEQDLMKIVPKKDWRAFSHLLIMHGREVCNAKKPLCSKCQLNSLCPKAGVEKQY